MYRLLFKIFIVCAFGLFSGCSGEVSIENFDPEQWKNDKMGCKGERMEMKSTILETQKQLLGMKRNDILMLFGHPESTELYPKGQLLYRFHISPANACDDRDPEQQIEMFEIRLNALGIVSEAYISVYSNHLH